MRGVGEGARAAASTAGIAAATAAAYAAANSSGSTATAGAGASMLGCAGDMLEVECTFSKCRLRRSRSQMAPSSLETETLLPAPSSESAHWPMQSNVALEAPQVSSLSKLEAGHSSSAGLPSTGDAATDPASSGGRTPSFA